MNRFFSYQSRKAKAMREFMAAEFGEDWMAQLSGGVPVSFVAETPPTTGASASSFTEPRRTTVMIRTPKDVDLILAGVPAKTKNKKFHVLNADWLAPGQVYRNYEFKTVQMIDGKEVVKTKSIDLVGGHIFEISFE